MSRKLRVLLLDKYVDYLPDLSPRGIVLDVTHERAWNDDVYLAPGTTLAKIRELTAVGNYDIVVLGNNLGAGVPKASAIDRRLRERTVVVWNDDYFISREKADYEKVGLKRFMTRVALPAYIVNIVTN